MKKLLVFIILVLALLGILEYLNVVPSRPIGVLSLLAESANFIRSLHIQSYYIVVPDISLSVQDILILLFILFIVGYLYERFRSIEQNQKVIMKRINEINKNNTNSTETEMRSGDENMNEIASEIRNFLEILSKSINTNQTTPIRSKKVRRVSSEVILDNTSIEESPRTQSTSNDIVNIDSNEDTIDITQNEASGPKDEINSLDNLDDNNLSKIDLARALIQSEEIDKAREVLLDIIKNGSSQDAHEARILNLQIS
tara:strand:+ start:300 stop:1067 length:768 start_codon:yes stop_codon:yes gene_type:complete